MADEGPIFATLSLETLAAARGRARRGRARGHRTSFRSKTAQIRAFSAELRRGQRSTTLGLRNHL